MYWVALLANVSYLILAYVVVLNYMPTFEYQVLRAALIDPYSLMGDVFESEAIRQALLKVSARIHLPGSCLQALIYLAMLRGPYTELAGFGRGLLVSTITVLLNFFLLRLIIDYML